MTASLNGVYTGDYGNKFVVVDVETGGKYGRCKFHIDHTSFSKHIKIVDQPYVLEEVANEICRRINSFEEKTDAH